jgi:hypothetical protein
VNRRDAEPGGMLPLDDRVDPDIPGDPLGPPRAGRLLGPLFQGLMTWPTMAGP